MEERRTSTTVAAELDEGVLDGRRQPPDDGSDVLGALNYLAGNVALRAIVERAQADGPLQGSDLRLYLYDEAVGRLVPTVATVEAVTQWPPGVGAAGVAYSSGEFVVARGDAVRDATYGVTEELAARYDHLASVAAMPVFNAGEDVIGVVTASTTDPTLDLSETEPYDALNLVALLASRVLVDLLRWFDDP